MTDSFNRVIEAFRAKGLEVEMEVDGSATCQGPGHNSGDRSIHVTKTYGRTLIHSFGKSDVVEVLESLDLSYEDLMDSDKIEYNYPDGRMVTRTPAKDFYQRNANGKSLYRTEFSTDPIYLVDGEADVHILEEHGESATCGAGGANNLHLFDLTPLYGRNVVVIKDNDDGAGEEQTKKAIELLAGKAKSLKVVTALVGKDASDHIAAGYGVSDFQNEKSYDTMIYAKTVVHQIENSDSIDEIKSNLYRTVRQTDSTDSNLVRFDKAYDEWLEWMAEDPEGQVIPTPWLELDDLLSGGIYKKALYLLAARPGVGKTVGLNNFAMTAAERGYKGVVWSVEMPRHEVVSRMLAAGASVNYGEIRRRSVQEQDIITDYAKRQKDIGLWICDDPRITINELASAATRMKQEHNIDFIAVDYLQLINPNRKGTKSRSQEVGEISWELKTLAKELDIAVVCAVQLNRGNAQEGRPPRVDDLRESGQLEQDCDVCILLHHTEDGTIEFNVGKNRNGPTGSIELAWQPQYARIR
ncbi:DnaB-like dsDNA helicase [Gordonia phage Guey18]|nr:DnaB-like dsDNA helicase [Gordonia phage Guey18]